MLKLLKCPQLYMQVHCSTTSLLSKKYIEKSTRLVLLPSFLSSSLSDTIKYSQGHKNSGRGVYGVYSPFRIHYSLDANETQGIVRYQHPELMKLDKIHLNEILKFLKHGNYEWEEIKRNTDILFLTAKSVQERIHLLNECGILHPRLHDIVYINGFMQRNLSVLHSHNIYRRTFNVIDFILQKVQELNLSKIVITTIQNQFKECDDVSLETIHLYILAHYLSKRFQTDLTTAKEVIKLKKPSWKPLTSYTRICDVLINVLKFNVDNVKNSTVLLDIDPVNAFHIVNKSPVIGGTPVTEIILEYPQLLLIPHENLVKWNRIFEKYKAKRFLFTTATVLLFKTNLFKQVEERLQFLQTLPEYKIMMMSPKFMYILREPCAIKYVVNSTQCGKTINSIGCLLSEKFPITRAAKNCSLSNETKLYISKKLELSKTEKLDLAIFDEIKSTRGMANTAAVIKLLLKYGFSKEQVLNGLEAVKYDHEALKAFLEEFSLLSEVQPFDEWMRDPYVVQLLMFCVEKYGTSTA